jgi:hypothetical protein
MLHHVRSKWLAGGGALLLVLSMSGLVSAATLVDDTTPATIATFEDLNGNGIDDHCETAVTANPDAVTLAMAAADTNADGVISTTEAAQSDWTGGANCNHGGYVSTVAKSSGDACDAADAPATPEATTDEGASDDGDHAANETSTSDATVAPDCSADAPEADATDAAKDAARAACEAAMAAGTPVVLPVMTHVELAQSDLVGGKNCNHGGAVSDANKAAKAERDAAKSAAREARQAAKALKSHGHKHGGQN